jgi:signal transduction histidine kinase
VTQVSVMIISDETDFSRTVVARWQSELTVPSFTVLSSDTFGSVLESSAELVIFGGIEDKKLAKLLTVANGKFAKICVAKTQAQASALRKSHPRVLTFAQHEAWADFLVLLAGESLRRVDAARRAQEAESESKRLEYLATLGEYTLEMRHNLNNALTSVLGNAELLMLEPGALTAEGREQLDTIHNMTLLMHEILQRFSSIESELRFAEKASHAETEIRSHRVGEQLPNLSGISATSVSAKTYSAKLK